MAWSYDVVFRLCPSTLISVLGISEIQKKPHLLQPCCTCPNYRTLHFLKFGRFRQSMSTGTSLSISPRKNFINQTPSDNDFSRWFLYRDIFLIATQLYVIESTLMIHSLWNKQALDLSITLYSWEMQILWVAHTMWVEHVLNLCVHSAAPGRLHRCRNRPLRRHLINSIEWTMDHSTNYIFIATTRWKYRFMRIQIILDWRTQHITYGTTTMPLCQVQ